MAAAAQSGGGVAQKQIEELGERIDRGFEKLERKLDGIDERVRGLENREAGCQPVITSRLDLLSSDVSDHEKEIQVLKDTVVSLANTVKIVSWAGTILGGAVLLWLINNLLGLIK